MNYLVQSPRLFAGQAGLHCFLLAEGVFAWYAAFAFEAAELDVSLFASFEGRPVFPLIIDEFVQLMVCRFRLHIDGEQQALVVILPTKLIVEMPLQVTPRKKNRQ